MLAVFMNRRKGRLLKTYMMGCTSHLWHMLTWKCPSQLRDDFFQLLVVPMKHTIVKIEVSLEFTGWVKIGYHLKIGGVNSSRMLESGTVALQFIGKEQCFDAISHCQILLWVEVHFIVGHFELRVKQKTVEKEQFNQFSSLNLRPLFGYDRTHTVQEITKLGTG